MQTEEKILNAAYHCFMNFGYSGTSIVMIGKYADVSRFTVHNHFKNKEDLFRAVVKGYGECAKAQCKTIIESNAGVWQKLQQATEVWFAPVFKETIDQIVFDDLSNAFHKHAEDIRQENEAFLMALFVSELNAAVSSGEIDLTSLNRSAEDVALFLSTSIHCIKANIDINYMPDYIDQLIGVYRVATSPQTSN